MRPYSKDLRERVIAAVETGHSAREAGRLYRVSESTAIKWVQRWRATGKIEAKPYPGTIGSRLDSVGDWLRGLIESEPDITLEEMRTRLVDEKGLRVGRGTVWRFCRREELTFKKKPCAPPSKIGSTWLWRAGSGASGSLILIRDV